MLQSIISNKVQKSKQNIQTYLSNPSSNPSQPQSQPVPPSTTQSAVRPTQSSTFHSQNNMTTSGGGITASAMKNSSNSNKLGKNQIQVKIINVAGKQIVKEGTVFRWSKEEGKFQFVFEDEGLKTKLEGKRESLVGKRIKPNYTDGSITFQIKQAIYKKQDTKQSSLKGSTVWSTGKQVNQHTVAIWLKQKEHLKPLMQSPFMQGLIDTNAPSLYVDQPKNVELQPVEEGADIEEDHGHVKLVAPTAAQQGEVEKIRKIIKEMKEEDKVTVLMEVFKIKKQYDDPASMIKKLKCPVSYCIYCQKKSYKDIQQLKNHLKIKHPELSKHGIELSEYDGTFEYGSKAMDLALFIGKMYPQEMKKIIKQMKTKQPE